MACIRKRRGKYVVDYRDSAGIRRWVTCETRREADDVLSTKVRETRQQTRPVCDPNITVEQYSVRWLEVVGVTRKRRTGESYTQIVKAHINPALGPVKVRLLSKGRVKAFLVEKLKTGLSKSTVRMINAVLRAMCSAALGDELITMNPADKLGKELGLVESPKARQDEIKVKAFDRDQLSVFLAAAECAEDRYLRRQHPMYLTSARTGLRLGELLGLQWGDIDFLKHEIRVSRQITRRRLETLKSGYGRTVDMSEQLERVLQRLLVERKTETLKRGWREMPAWVFCTAEGTPFDESRVRKAMRRVLKAAGLPLHFSPHCFRHTYASLLLQQGESPEYVRRQLGHSSIVLTTNTYGQWLPAGNRAAVNRLDDPSGSKTVAEARVAVPGDSQARKILHRSPRRRSVVPLSTGSETAPNGS